MVPQHSWEQKKPALAPLQGTVVRTNKWVRSEKKTKNERKTTTKKTTTLE